MQPPAHLFFGRSCYSHLAAFDYGYQKAFLSLFHYLAQRDSEWMGEIYRFLGLTVGVVTGGMMHTTRQQAYAADITYGTNNEFGFDYLQIDISNVIKRFTIV